MRGTRDFLMYSFPGDVGFRLLRDAGAGAGPCNVIVQPFDAAKSPMEFGSDAAMQCTPDSVTIKLLDAPAIHLATKKEYISLVEEARKICSETNGKIVLSRSVDVMANTAQWPRWMQRMRHSFPGSFVSLLHSREYGTWLSASPEPLLTQHEKRYTSVALAGTRWDNEIFGMKEREEQQLVTDTIVKRLTLYQPRVSAPLEVRYGNIRHLQSAIEWQSTQEPGYFAQILHPTPAVCGVPEEEAMNFITHREGRPRELYTGFIGIQESEQKSRWFVHLRCMQLFRDRVRFYVGGGVNAHSDPAEEWEETERKKKTLMEAMMNNDSNL